MMELKAGNCGLDRRAEEPRGCAYTSSRVDAAKVVDFGTSVTKPEWEIPGNRAKDGVKDVYDSILADDNTGDQVSRCDSRKPFDFGVENKDGDESANVNETNEAEQDAINNENSLLDTSPRLGPLLVGNISQYVE